MHSHIISQILEKKSPKNVRAYLNGAAPPPPLMIAFIKATNRSPYSFGGNWLIFFYEARQARPKGAI